MRCLREEIEPLQTLDGVSAVPYSLNQNPYVTSLGMYITAAQENPRQYASSLDCPGL